MPRNLHHHWCHDGDVLINVRDHGHRQLLKRGGDNVDIAHPFILRDKLVQRRGVDHAVEEQCIQVDHAARQGQRLEHGELDASRHTEEEERFQHDRGGTMEAWQLDVVRVSC